MANKNVKPKPEEKEKAKGYHPVGDEKKVYDQFLYRKNELLNSRRSVYGMDIDRKMREMDKRYFERKADIPPSELDPEQSPIAINNAFGKVQTALGILIDRNPEIYLEEDSPKYSANRELIKGLANASWKNTNSLGQLKLSIFNAAKRGWFVGRTFYRELKHDARFLERVEKDGKKVHKTVEIKKVDDVQYMNINNFNAWIDEETVPEDFYSTRDWMWREVVHIDELRKQFPEDEYPNMKYVVAGGDTRETIEGHSDKNTAQLSSPNEAKQTKEGMTEVFYYENQYDDWFIVEINGVMVVWEPLPQDHKRLSCVYGYWNLRSAETIYGIGVVEAMERDEQLIDRILNMTMRHLLLTISPPGFYTGTEDPEDENLRYRPGQLSRTLDPNNIKFLEVPQGNQNALENIDWVENKSDQRTGITRTLEGEVSSGSTTAFETGVNRESGLKRLRLPLKSIQYALEWEFRNRIDLIRQTYTDFKVELIDDPEDVQNYLDEVGADPTYYFIENEGDPENERFYAKQYRDVQMEVDQDEKGNFVESEEKRFFKIKPEMLHFEGDVVVDASSILVQSEELEKADTLRMANILLPLLAQGDPAIIGRSVKQMLIAFNKDPKKWLPDSWLQSIEEQGKIGSGEKKPENDSAQEGGVMKEKLDTVVPQSEVNGRGGTSLGSRFSAAFNAFRNPQ